MTPSPAPTPDPAATCVPYDQASPAQLTQALAYLVQELTACFPTLDFPSWTRAFLACEPALWVAGEQVYLDHADLTRLNRRLADAIRMPELDPPISAGDAAYLSSRMVNGQDAALVALPEMAQNPLAYGPSVFALVTRMAMGNSVADRVYAATHRGPQGRPGRPDPALARAAAPGQVWALCAARGMLGYLPAPLLPAGPPSTNPPVSNDASTV